MTSLRRRCIDPVGKKVYSTGPGMSKRQKKSCRNDFTTFSFFYPNAETKNFPETFYLLNMNAGALLTTLPLLARIIGRHSQNLKQFFMVIIWLGCFITAMTSDF